MLHYSIPIIAPSLLTKAMWIILSMEMFCNVVLRSIWCEHD